LYAVVKVHRLYRSQGQRRGDLLLKKDPSNRYDKNGPIVSPLLSISRRKFSCKKTPFTNRDRNKALLDIFGKGSAFSAKAACPFPPSGSLGNRSKALSIHMTKTSHLSDQFGGFCERNFPRRKTPLTMHDKNEPIVERFDKGSAKTTKQQAFLPAAGHKNRADAIASTLYDSI